MPHYRPLDAGVFLHGDSLAGNPPTSTFLSLHHRRFGEACDLLELERVYSMLWNFGSVPFEEACKALLVARRTSSGIV